VVLQVFFVGHGEKFLKDEWNITMEVEAQKAERKFI